MYRAATAPPVEEEQVAAEQEPGAGEKSADGKSPTDSNAASPDSQANPSNPATPDSDPKTSETEKPKTHPQLLLTIGSASPNSTGRLLATLNSRGASVQRVELIDRTKRGDFKYRHVDDRTGYLGNLELTLDPKNQGLIVGVVGPGTPADLATAPGVTGGLKPGDILQSINGNPVVVAEQYFAEMEKYSNKDEIKIGVLRGAASLLFTTKLSSKPLEMVEPLPHNALATDQRHRESFLIQVGHYQNGIWRNFPVDLAEANWEFVAANSSADVAEFRYELPKGVLEPAKIAGPIQVIKRFSVPPKSAEVKGDFDRSFHLNMDVEVRNLSTIPQDIGIKVLGPTGLPDEGWWYLTKIHGSATALFRSAGVRDVISKSRTPGTRFLGGPQIVSRAIDGESTEVFVTSVPAEQRTVDFVGIDTHYFNVSLISPPTEGNEFVCRTALAQVAQDPTTLPSNQQRRMDLSFELLSEPISVAPYDATKRTGALTRHFEIFTGPKYPELLENYGLGETVTFGWFAWFSKPILAILHGIYYVFGNYGIAIVLLTVIVRLAILPISRKAALNAQMMQVLQPEIQAINEKYKNDFEKKAKAQQDLFRKHKYNPMGGCLLMFLQLPILIGLYRGLSVDIELRDKPLIPGMEWCSNLAGPDRLFRWDGAMDFLTAETGWLGPYFNVLPIFTIALFLIQQKLFMPPAMDEQQKATQNMMNIMMIFMCVMFYKVPSGLCIYFITSSIWGIAERKLLPKPKLPERTATDTTVVEAEKSTANQNWVDRKRKERDRKKGK